MTYPHSQVTWLAIDHPFCRRLSGSALVTILAGKLSKRTLRGMVRIQLCGRFAVVIDGQATESRLPGRQGRLLVAYLAAHRAQPVERTALLDALWPEGGTGAAGTLTVLLSKVRSLLVPAEIRGRRTLQLALPANSVVDLDLATTSLHSAESAVALRDWRRAWPTALAAQYAARRRFLAEFEAPWIDEWRRQLDVIYERALACYAEACLGIGGTELPAAERAARRLVAHAPLAETGHRLLMRALAARGDAADALAVYGQLRQQLREELGVSPCPATQALHTRLLRGQPLDEPARPVTNAG
jgi:SARP family transcriptional regulator, regulator of embCAB operon